MKDADMEKVVAELQLQFQSCVDQTGCEPSMEDYEGYLYSDEFEFFLEANCSENFAVDIIDVFNYMLSQYKSNI